MSRTYLEQIEAAYQGEVYGEAMYAAIARSLSHTGQAHKWRVLTRMETQVKAEMRVLVQRLGGETLESADSRQRGLLDARAYIGLPWDALMRRFSAELDPVIAEYAALEAAAPDEDRPTLMRLTRHEVVAKRFCELELAGRADASLNPIDEFLAQAP